MSRGRISRRRNFEARSLSSSVPTALDRNEIEWIHGQRPVTRCPVEMGTGHAPCRANESDLLPPFDGLALRYVRPAQMKVSRDYSTAVIDVHDIPSEEEFVHERDYAAVCRNHRRADSASEVDAEMPARNDAVEGASGAEPARDSGRSRTKK